MSSIAVVLLIWTSGLSLYQAENAKTAKEGGSFTFNVSVTHNGYLRYNRQTVFTVPEDTSNRGTTFKGRVHWDKKNGRITITNITTGDSGEYELEVDNTVEKFTLTVYKPVSKPEVRILKDTCTAECSVENGRQVSLFWNGDKDSVKLNQTISQYHDHQEAIPSHDKTLRLSVHMQGRSQMYFCIARNPADHNMMPLSAPDNCVTVTVDLEKILSYAGIVLGILLLIAIIGVIYCIWRRSNGDTGSKAT